jgi:hypothetical protein
MAKGYIVDRAIDDAAFILERIDKRWPAGYRVGLAKGHLLGQKQNKLPVLFSLNHEEFLGCRFRWHPSHDRGNSPAAQ